MIQWLVQQGVDNEHVPDLLTSFAIQAYREYEKSGSKEDIDKAVGFARASIGAGHDGDPSLIGKLNNLGVMLESRYERTGAMADLEEAIGVARQAVESTTHDHPNRAGRLSNLGNKLVRRYERTGAMADLEEAIGEAIGVARQAVESTPHDHPARAGRLNNLGNKLERRYERTGAMADLEEAIGVARQAVESTPHDHPNRAACLNNLGNGLGRRYERTGAIADLEATSSCLHDAWLCHTAIPFHRIQAAARCLKLLVAQTKIDVAISLGQAVIDLLPAVNTKLLDRNDQQYVMSIFAGVATDVCAFLLASNQPTNALEYLEKGRTVIIGQLVDGRSDVSALTESHPDMARRYEQLRDEVNRPSSRLDKDAGGGQVAGRRREAVAELDACIHEIRSIAGNERFLLGQTAAEMQQCAVGGTIVVVNITRFRSDAILVSRKAVKALSLPGLLASDAEAWLGKKWTGRGVRRHERAQKNKEYLEYLAWLWDVCVRPVFNEVHKVDDTTDRLSRIWWIGTGLGSSMPFHAAGVHSPGSTENAFSKAVSSYTPSIKALEYAQQRAGATDGARGALLIAAMPTTPGQVSQPDAYKPPDLPGVAEEKKKITEIVNGHVPIEPLDLPSVDQVVDKLTDCYIAHFACHGSTDHADPSNSGLILQKRREGQEAEQDRLTVHRVSELRLAHARIAYLSACSTAENRAAQLSDEVIHVVSGFQVAGFPYVVGCLWPSIDWVCVEVASGFYRSLLRRRGAGWDGGEVAWAVREAVMAVREAEMDRPLAWAQFVHFGA
ncbi:CHAT domain-containing protein [Corynascus novoguineensis]|uniref:CHAT domain-containing protein n=1 Tax=Corynascus novoguineensis TaxID=1126955 RepID=A0AAN7CJ19_9PEZI|nr:CHAT domain-containing protein [Corynascus novoguineensis]